MNKSKQSFRLLGQFSIFIGVALLVYIFLGSRFDIEKISEKTLLIITACSNICIGSFLIQRSRKIG